MIFYKGFPRATGVTDFCDSAVMAGLLSVFKWPDFNMPVYFDQYKNPIRSGASDIPNDECFDPMTFSRDQLSCLIAGYYCQSYSKTFCKYIYDKVVENNWLCPNNDLLSPSHRGHIKTCVGIQPSWLEEKWLYFDILYAALVQPMQENNQLLCMLMIRDIKFLKLYTKLNKSWKECIREYWCEAAGSWRAEPELASHIIKFIEDKIK